MRKRTITSFYEDPEEIDSDAEVKSQHIHHMGAYVKELERAVEKGDFRKVSRLIEKMRLEDLRVSNRLKRDW